MIDPRTKYQKRRSIMQLKRWTSDLQKKIDERIRNRTSEEIEDALRKEKEMGRMTAGDYLFEITI